MKSKLFKINSNTKNYIPFKNLSLEGWTNLLLASTLTVYIIWIAYWFLKGEICSDFAFDYCGFWSAGKVINKYSYADVYNHTLPEFQKEIFLSKSSPNSIFSGIPVVYLPLFLIPFKYLAIINLKLSYFVWTIINLTAFVLYLRFFSKAMVGYRLPNKLLILSVISFQVFMNTQEGQVNIWLMICVGEFIRAMLNGTHLKAGLWLGGLLLKPQLLILILPLLLFYCMYKTLVGFIFSAFLISLISFRFIGVNGFVNLINLLLDFSGGVPSNNISAMTNIRMLGWHLISVIGVKLSSVFIITGIITTIFFTFFVFRRNKEKDKTLFVVTMLGIFAATCIITWHAHLHMSIVLIPLILYLILKKEFNIRMFYGWVFIPIYSFLACYILSVIFVLTNASVNVRELMRFSTGFSGFVSNLAVLLCAMANFNQKAKKIKKDAWV